MAAVWVIGLGLYDYIGVCRLMARAVNALCAYGGLPVVTDACLLYVRLMCVNFASALSAVGRDDDDSARININTSDVSSFPLAGNND